MDVKQVFGENLRYYRRKLGYTQETLAEKLDIGTTHLANLEIGKKFVSAGLLQNISKTLNVPYSALFYNPEQDDLIDDSFLGKVNSSLDEEVLLLKKKIRDYYLYGLDEIPDNKAKTKRR